MGLEGVPFGMHYTNDAIMWLIRASKVNFPPPLPPTSVGERMGKHYSDPSAEPVEDEMEGPAVVIDDSGLVPTREGIIRYVG